MSKKSHPKPKFKSVLNFLTEIHHKVKVFFNSINPKTSRHLFMRLSAQEQILFAKRLALLHKAGVPILTALKLLKKQARSKASIHIIDHLYTQVENGKHLSTGMEKYKKVFGEFAVNIVRVGEISGTLSENLGYLAEELKKRQELKRKIVSALIYPIFIVFATIGIIILLVAYVFPKILPVFQTFKFQLPWATRSLIAVTTGFGHFWPHILGGLSILIIAIFLLLRLNRIRVWFDRNLLRLPFLGRLLQNYQIINSTRTLSLLLKSDVKIIEALEIVADASTNLAYRQSFNSMAKKMTRGEKISTSLENDEVLFPVILSGMVAIGEVTGKLSDALLYLAEMFEDELNDQTRNLTTSIEPILMIFMGVLVGFIAISIITPIYNITQNLRP